MGCTIGTAPTRARATAQDVIGQYACSADVVSVFEQTVSRRDNIRSLTGLGVMSDDR